MIFKTVSARRAANHVSMENRFGVSEILGNNFLGRQSEKTGSPTVRMTVRETVYLRETRFNQTVSTQWAGAGELNLV